MFVAMKTSVRKVQYPKSTKVDGCKRRAKKEDKVFTRMERYLGLDQSINNMASVERDLAGFCEIKQEYLDKCGNELELEICQVALEEKQPSPRLSPRKHASTLSRCAATSKENVTTPHRIRLCEEVPDVKGYSKRTRRRLNAALEETGAPAAAAAALHSGSDVKEERVAIKHNHNDSKCTSALHNGALGKERLNGHIKLETKTLCGSGDRKLTEFFPIRRSVRKTKKEVEEEKYRAIEAAILEEREEGLQVKLFEGKGRGVVAGKRFHRGEFVVEYAGELVSIHEAKQREARYAQDANKGCYMYYFKHNNNHYCIDATAESGRLGRLVNHCRNGNLITKPILLHHRPHLVLLAAQDIYPGDEVTYDYGDRSRESLLAHPWLAF